MNQCDDKSDGCNLHFGDPTAHATVDWFVSQSTSLNNLTNHSDALYKYLTAVRFVDCLRQRIHEDEELFKRISESIGAELKQGEKWKKYPNLSVFLLSIARNNETLKNTPLYSVGEKLYEHFKENPDPDLDSDALVLEVGIQLARFQENNKPWLREFANFKSLHYEELNKLRLHYYSVDNPTKFSLRAVERWERLYYPTIQESEVFHPEFKKLAQELKNLDLKSNTLHPLCLELPISARSAEALKYANRFVQDLEDEKKDIDEKKVIVEELAEKFRILQWAVLVRNLVEEHELNRKHTLPFYPIIDSANIPGMSESPIKGLLIKFINKARSAECLFKPTDGEIPTKQRLGNRSREEFPPDRSFIERKIKECHKSFKILLPKVPDLHVSVYTDLVRAFANIRNAGDSSSTILIEDGELSFFSLIWLLRYAKGQKEQPTVWQSDPSKRLTVRFHPGILH